MQRPPNPPVKHTRMKGKEGGKTNCEISSRRATGTILLHTLPQSLCQTVYNMHTQGEVQN